MPSRLLLVVCLLAGSCGAAPGKTVDEAFNAELRAWMATHAIARANLAVMREGRLVHVAGFGDRRADARVGIWSLSKAITAACIATLVREKKLSFDRPIGPLLEATFKQHGPPADPRLATVTVLQLLSHRSGLPTWVGGNRFAPGTGALLRRHAPATAAAHQLLPEMLKISLTKMPGSQHQYSNVGYLLLGRIIEQATGKSYEAACHERVLRPSGIAKAGLHGTWGRLLDSTAGWELSPAEYLAFARHLRPTSKTLLDTGAHAILVKTDGFWRDESKETAYTLGVNVWPVARAPPHLSHTGGWDWMQSDAQGGPIDENSGTLFVLTSDGVAWFASFDPILRANELRIRTDLGQAMWRAKRAVTTWPAADLFPQHLGK